MYSDWGVGCQPCSQHGLLAPLYQPDQKRIAWVDFANPPSYPGFFCSHIHFESHTFHLRWFRAPRLLLQSVAPLHAALLLLRTPPPVNNATEEIAHNGCCDDWMKPQEIARQLASCRCCDVPPHLCPKRFYYGWQMFQIKSSGLCLSGENWEILSQMLFPHWICLPSSSE